MSTIINDSAVLVVDDEESVADLFCKMLSGNYQVFKATSGEEALEVLRGNKVDLVLADQGMPDMTGIELFAAIEKQHLDIGKVLITGAGDSVPVLVEAINIGAVDKYLKKPSSKDQILQVIHKVLDDRFQKHLADQQDAEKQMMQHAKMSALGELVAGILHEINNPLSYIHANLGNLLKFSKRLVGLIEDFDQVALSDEVRAELAAKKEAVKYDYLKDRITEMIERSLVGAERMKKIIQDYKSFSRASDAKFEEADIHEAIDTTLTLLHHNYKGRIEIKKHYADIPLLRCNIAKLNQVFMNLLVNSIQAIEGSGEIEITTGLEDGMVVISISDTGCGMPESVIKKIFDPFFTTKPDGVGTGLGLSILSGIMKQHQGRVSVKSTPGSGTTFTLKMPINLRAEDMADTQPH